MKRVILAGVSALAMVTMMGAANAADLPRRQEMPVKAPLYQAPYNWTGFYLGINGGGGFGGKSDFSGAFGDGSADPDGGLVGGTIGYNWQLNRAVFGLEGDIDWSSIRGSSACGGGAFSCETRNDWLATVRGRLGYSFDRFMPYVTGGVAFGNIKASVGGVGDTNEVETGWTVGGGIEAVIAGPWTAKVEYLYVDLGNSDSINTPVGATDADFTTNIVRAGVNYRF